MSAEEIRVAYVAMLCGWCGAGLFWLYLRGLDWLGSRVERAARIHSARRRAMGAVE